MSPVTREHLQRLADPFAPEDIEWRIQTAGEKNGKPWARVLAYITNRAIMERLDAVVGPENWKNAFHEAPAGGLMCVLSIYVTREDGTSEWVPKVDGAENTDVEPVKGGMSGAMKRAAVQWGIGRYLYNLEEGWANVHDGGRLSGRTKDGKWFKWDPPTLPDWAMPKPRHATADQLARIDALLGIVKNEKVRAGVRKRLVGGLTETAAAECIRFLEARAADAESTSSGAAPAVPASTPADREAKAGRDGAGRNLAKAQPTQAMPDDSAKTGTFPEKMPPQLRDLAGKALAEIATRRLTEALDFMRLRGGEGTDAWVERIGSVLEERRLTGNAGPAEGPAASRGSHNVRGDLPGDPAVPVGAGAPADAAGDQIRF